MFRISALVIALAFSGLMVSAPAVAQQQMPLAGAAGAGNTPISGVPFGPANPSVLSDPSGILNASTMPPLGTNAPAPPTAYGSVNSSPPSPARVAPPPYAGASQRFTSARDFERRKPARHRGRAQVGSFKGSCRGC